MKTELFKTNKNIKETKIAIISDIHFYVGYNQKIFDSIIKQLITNQPTYITVVGDILDSSDTSDLTQLKTFIKELSNIAKTFIVLGNHDEKKGQMHHWSFEPNKELVKLISEIENTYLLRDSSYTENNITFYGLDFSYEYYEKDYETYESFCNEMKEKKCNIPKNTYNITLIHTPVNIYNFLKLNKKHPLNNSDLILSGHMHNGCLPYWFTNIINKLFHSSRSIISPARKIFPKYAQGRIYERDGYVYEGITKLSHSTKSLHFFNNFYHKKVKFITIKKDQ